MTKPLAITCLLCEPTKKLKFSSCTGFMAEIQKFQSLNPVPNLELLHLLGNGINSAYNWYK